MRRTDSNTMPYLGPIMDSNAIICLRLRTDSITPVDFTSQVIVQNSLRTGSSWDVEDNPVYDRQQEDVINTMTGDCAVITSFGRMVQSYIFSLMGPDIYQGSCRPKKQEFSLPQMCMPKLILILGTNTQGIPISPCPPSKFRKGYTLIALVTR